MRAALIVLVVVLLRVGVWVATEVGIEVWRTRCAGRAYLEAEAADGVLAITTSVGSAVVELPEERVEAWNRSPHAVWVLQRGTDDEGVACLRLLRVRATPAGIDVAVGGWLAADRFDIEPTDAAK